MSKSKKRTVFIVVGIVIILAVIVVANLKKSSGPKVKVQTVKVEQGELVATVSGPARIQPEVQVKISAKVSGQIVRMDVKEGDIVKTGDFLVQLDPEYYQAAVEQSRSNLNYAKAGFSKANNEYDRSKTLFADNLISASELDIAKSTYEQALAQVEQSEAALKQAKDNLAKTTIYAPMDGTVSQLNKKVGEMAMGSQFTLDVIMIVSDLAKMQAEVEIDENDVVAVSLNDTAKIQIDAFPDTTFKGLVTEIANTGQTQGMGTQEEVTNFMVDVFMLDKPDRIRPGMSATVDIVVDKKAGAVKIPIQCVTVREPVDPEKSSRSSRKKDKKEDKTEAADKEILTSEMKKDKKPVEVVFVVEGGVANQRPVTIGISSETHWEIVKGLKADETIVSGSFRVLSKQLKDGDEVKIENNGNKSKFNKR